MARRSLGTLLARHLPFSPTTTPLQAITYLLFVSLSSIAFLVFLNAALSFVITARLGVVEGVGNLVGTLGFVDELVAIVACPLAGALSDRVGVRWVCVVGFGGVAGGLVAVVSVGSVVPGLVAARVLFSLGGAATATMVTAILPAVTGVERPRGERREAPPTITTTDTNDTTTATPLLSPPPTPITPLSRASRASTPPRMAGLVGLFTGLGALLALTLFLPLPAQFASFKGITQSAAVAYAFYTVATVAVLVAGACFIGLRGIRGDDGKGWHSLFGRASTNTTDASPVAPPQPYHRLLLSAAGLAFTSPPLRLAYLGGFVARASSVAISLFIPLSINAFFMRHGFCRGAPNDTTPELKDECRAAYVLAAQLTGASQLVALLCAPLFGILSDRYRRFNAPLVGAAAAGVVGFVAFARLESPEIGNVEGRGGSAWVFLIVALIGISQIGAIVCSLGLLGRGVQGEDGGYTLSSQLGDEYRARSREGGGDDVEAADGEEEKGMSHLKGSIAGVYSLSGAAAILLLTKLGGYLFDEVAAGAPFYMMAAFNGVLLVVGVVTAAHGELTRARKRRGVALD
ncbi:hypothetical protein VC83_08118 [Pseudogymnoascus destructans]|uniref:Major facilitator superfamily (MFS) profile domain-containing protein n=1 Tax=Pseudogymnoascus destructans TaxID=655981 RepID=A0A177A2F2_9PEZI|nr:uncharacterized protein VC83_08118 [Pseudogymnoascus destructans]OAF55263.1 hypothetical protein VC83_08118 [Pseudogymnoascus destructans]